MAAIMTGEARKMPKHIEIEPVAGETGVWQPIDNVDPDKPIFSIGAASTMLEVHPRTLRIYEQETLINPSRRGQRRYYSLNDIQWITCLRSMIHDHGISIAGLKKLLQYTACWNIVKCPLEKRKACTAYSSLGLLSNK
jgi:MerR family transcriptional regulator/heat shock protein HspR